MREGPVLLPPSSFRPPRPVFTQTTFGIQRPSSPPACPLSRPLALSPSPRPPTSPGRPTVASRHVPLSRVVIAVQLGDLPADLLLVDLGLLDGGLAVALADPAIDVLGHLVVAPLLLLDLLA